MRYFLSILTLSVTGVKPLMQEQSSGESELPAEDLSITLERMLDTSSSLGGIYCAFTLFNILLDT